MRLWAVDKQQVNPRSVTAVLTGGDGTKLHRKTTVSLSSLLVEANELTRVREVCKTVIGVCTPEVLDVDEQSCSLTTTHVDGDSLFNYIWNSTSALTRQQLSSAAAESIGTNVGKWLRTYHGSSFDERSLGEATELLASGRRKIARVSKARSTLLSKGECDSILDFLVRREGAVNDTNNHCRLHGDFTPVNMLIDERQMLCVLDFADSRVGLRAVDFARFWQEVWAVGQLGRRRQQIVSAILKAFQTAYGSQVPKRQFEFLRGWNAVCFLSSYVTSSHLLGISGRWTARRLARVHADWIRRAIAE